MSTTITTGTFNTAQWKGTYSSYYRYFRGWMDYTITETDTDYTITINNYGAEKVTSGKTTWEQSTSTVTISGEITDSQTISHGTGSGQTVINFGSDANSRYTYGSSVSRTWSKTISPQTKTITLTCSKSDGAWKGSGTDTLTLIVPSLEPYTISYNANGGTPTPESQTKYYGEPITTASAPTKANYTFTGWKWNDSGTAVNANTSWNGANANGTFVAQWEQSYTKPIISNVEVRRTSGTSTSDATYDPVGTKLYINITYTSGYKNGYIAPKCTVSFTGFSGSYVPTSEVTLTSGANKTQSYFYTGYNTNGFASTTSYNGTIKLWDSNDSTGTTYNFIVPSATFPIAILADGSAMGIMHAAVSGIPLILPKDTTIDGSLMSTDKTFRQVFLGNMNNACRTIDTSLTSSSTMSEWLTALLKAIVQNYPNYSSTLFRGRLNSAGEGFFDIFFYDTSTVNSNGIPRYTFGNFYRYSSNRYVFGTSNYNFYVTDISASSGMTVAQITTGTDTNQRPVTPKVLKDAYTSLIAPVDWTSQIVTGITGLIAVKALKSGNVCHIEFNYTSSTALGSGETLSGTFTTLPYKPAADVQGVGYFGTRAMVAWLTTSGAFTLRNTASSSATMNTNGGLYFSLTYICA